MKAASCLFEEVSNTARTTSQEFGAPISRSHERETAVPVGDQLAGGRSAEDGKPHVAGTSASRRDDHFYEELSRTNNQLANLHREMASKNAELAIAQKELQALNVQLEARVEQRTKDLLEAIQKAERASLAKSEFLSRTSHELRTPLNAILGFGQLLQMDACEPRDAENIAQILHAGQHLLTLIDEVLDMSDAETGQLTFALQPVWVAPLIEETLCLVRSLSAQLRVELIVAAPPEPHWHVVANRGRLKRVLLNLLSNAVKYNRQGGKVMVRCALSTAGTAPALRCSVHDIGLGISEKDLAQLFTPFDRLGMDRSQSRVAGAGLGLAFAKRMIEAMGGRIGVESTLGEGSTFWIEIPMAASPPAPLPSQAAPAFPSPEPRVIVRQDSEAHGPRKLLYIADDQSTLRLITRMLARRPSIELLAADTGELGLKLARDERPDLLLLDVDRGKEVLSQLRTDPRTSSVPVVIISAAPRPHIGEWLAAGASALLAKPVDVRHLLAAVDQFAERQPAVTA